MVFNAFSIFMFFATSAIMLIIPFVASIVLLNDFYDAWIYIPYMVLIASLGTFVSFFGALYLATKNTVGGMKSTLYGAVFNVILCILLIPSFKIIGAIFASLSSYLLMCLLRFIDISSKLTIKCKIISTSISFISLLVTSTVALIGSKDIYLITSFISLLIVISLNFKSIIGIKELIRS